MRRRLKPFTPSPQKMQARARAEHTRDRMLRGCRILSSAGSSAFRAARAAHFPAVSVKFVNVRQNSHEIAEHLPAE